MGVVTRLTGGTEIVAAFSVVCAVADGAARRLATTLELPPK